MHRRYILVCEKGWRGIREESFKLAARGVSSAVLIRGSVDRQVRSMITAHKGINNIFLPERFFTPILFICIIIALLFFRRGGVSVFLSKEKTYKRMKAFKKVFPHLELVEVYG